MNRSATDSRPRIALRAAAAALTFVPALAHELTHLLFAAPWADRVTLSVSVRRINAEAGVDWRGGVDSVPRWGIWLAAYGPLVIGAFVGIWGALRLLSGGVPEEPRTLLMGGVLAVWWVVYTAPSSDDHSAANGGS